MEDENKLDSLESLTQMNFEQKPNQAPEAIIEYLDNILADANNEEELEEKKILVNNIRKKLENKKYNQQFNIAITHTSLVVFLAVLRATNPDGDHSLPYEQYIREFLLFARQDDKDIYDMRLFYLDSLDADKMQVGEIPLDEVDEDNAVEQALIQKQVLEQRQNYEDMIGKLKKQYKERCIHLV